MWNNRIFKHPTKGYGVHETFYDDNGNVDGWTEESMVGYFQSVEDLKGAIELIYKDICLKDRPVLEDKDE